MECRGCQRQLLCSACFQARPHRLELVPPRAFFLTVPCIGHRFVWQGFCKGHRLDCGETSPGSLRASRGDGGCPCQAHSQYPQPDAIRRTLAACWCWGNLLRCCITPARSATEEEPNQSARSQGLGQAALVPTWRAVRLTEKKNPNVIGQKEICPAPITETAGSRWRALPAEGFKERPWGYHSAGATDRCQARCTRPSVFP